MEDTSEPKQFLSESDRLSLELAKAKKAIAAAEARTALANSENADLTYRLVIMQIYLKYGLGQNDALTENGEIIKNGAKEIKEV